jgi:NhaA family Na+:H+ antiporter
LSPWSAALAVPIFALLAAGVPVSGGTLSGVVGDPASVAVVVGLVVGKPLGVFLGAWLTARFTRASLDDGLAWGDIAAVGMLAGVGFTVSLLVTELAYEDSQTELVKTGVIIGSLLAAGLASIMLVRRNAVYRRLEEAEQTGQPEH